MLVKNYCKKNQIPAQDVIELLGSQYGGTWLLTSQLNVQIIDFLNQTFGNSTESKQLPASKEQLQLPESKNNSDLTFQNNSESNQIEQTETVNRVQLASFQTTQIIGANLNIQKQTIQQLLDNSNAEILDMISQNGQKLNGQLMENLQHDFDNLKAIKPYESKPVDTSAYDTLMAELEAKGIISTKS
ncbi:hypothetical protein A6769_37245 [Nostoc punctiforme NIES-2108]|uniref:Uncharacterized protein n=1 Tax=Nostoc punctiforme NIES-2108 TaxID=1356359 RepID=A0A367S360_NOSPU|nr:hypothetical protein A6769_37245 [Nostoc punctiforme NIES-2108]